MAQKNATVGFAWKTMEQYGVMGIQFILQLMLARILEPEVYGVVAIVMMFIAFSNVFIQKGFSTALVQKKEISKEDISSVFYVSLVIAAFFYSLIFFSASAIAGFFNMPELVGLLRVMCIGLFPGVYSSIQNALLRRDINFKVAFFASTISVSVSGGVAIWMAYHGYGVWALAAQQLIYCFLVVIVQYFQCRWYPMLHCNLNRVKYFWSFGWKVLVTGLINEIFVELRTMIIGKMYTKADLSFYNRGRQFPHLLMNSINGSLQAVLLPKFSTVQDNKTVICNMLKISISTSYFVLMPILVMLAFCAEPLVSVILTDKWLPCVPFLQLYCLYYVAWPLTSSCTQAIYAVGHSGIIMKLEGFRKTLDVLALLISVQFGALWIAVGAVLVELITFPLFVLPLRRLIGYSVWKQVRELIPVMAMSFLVYAITIGIGILALCPVTKLLLQVGFSIILYTSLSLTFQVEAGRYVFKRLKLLKDERRNAKIR